MIKLIIGFALLLLSSIIVQAQNEQVLPVDDQGKFIYYEVVELRGTPRDTLKARVLNYLNKKNAPFKYKSAQGDTSFSATGKLIINKTLLVMSHPSGEILYNFKAEVKEGKYRFWMTDFSFIPYQRDRYGNFVANTSIGTPLENNPGKLNVAQWKDYQVQAAAYAKDSAIKFRQYMSQKSAIIVVPEKKVVSKNW